MRSTEGIFQLITFVWIDMLIELRYFWLQRGVLQKERRKKKITRHENKEEKNRQDHQNNEADEVLMKMKC